MLDKIIRGINYKRSKKFSVLSNNGWRNDVCECYL
jgi:hypothetical protein